MFGRKPQVKPLEEDRSHGGGQPGFDEATASARKRKGDLDAVRVVFQQVPRGPLVERKVQLSDEMFYCFKCLNTGLTGGLLQIAAATGTLQPENCACGCYNRNVVNAYRRARFELNHGFLVDDPGAAWDALDVNGRYLNLVGQLDPTAPMPVGIRIVAELGPRR